MRKDDDSKQGVRIAGESGLLTWAGCHSGFVFLINSNLSQQLAQMSHLIMPNQRTTRGHRDLNPLFTL